LTNLSPLDQGGALTVGNFDGVHLGHASLIARLVQRAREVSGPAVVLTFDPHPICLLKPELAQPPLTTMERRAELLGELGVDVVIAYPTDGKLLSLSPQEFFESICCEAIGARVMVEGPNFFFGKDRAGDVKLLSEMCRQRGMSLEVMPPFVDGERMVSSSRVRNAIEVGDIARARELLTAPFRISGVVIQGDQRGRTIGFPTANLGEIKTLLPKPAVYAAEALVDGKTWPAAVNIGTRPTFGDIKISVEAHLIDFSANIYGQTIHLDLISRLREIRRFGSMDELKAQLRQDVSDSLAALGAATKNFLTEGNEDNEERQRTKD
jgi:riboflavin kinase/FMN adenylyltransferase